MKEECAMETDEQRKRLREDVLPEEAEPPGPGEEPVETEVQRGELRDRVQRALVKLPPEYREAVVLRDLEGRSYEEIAKVLGIRPGTVRSRIHRGREALRQLLAPYVEAEQ
jgi:RNA polymerase sigma factor (sigma-70 family)